MPPQVVLLALVHLGGEHIGEHSVPVTHTGATCSKNKAELHHLCLPLAKMAILGCKHTNTLCGIASGVAVRTQWKYPPYRNHHF